MMMALLAAGCTGDGISSQVTPEAPPDEEPPAPVSDDIEARHGYFTGSTTIDGESHYSEMLLTADGQVRYYILSEASDLGSTQFAGVVDWGDETATGSGGLFGDSCTGEGSRPYCQATGDALIQIDYATRRLLTGSLTVQGIEESWPFEMGWPAETYLQPASLDLISGSYEEKHAAFATDGDVIVSVDGSGSLFFQSPSKGCIGNGVLTPHADSRFNVYDVVLSISQCTSGYESLNRTTYQGLGTVTEYYADYWLVLWVSVDTGALTMWGIRL
jgi:hypothetical protein